MQAGIGSEPACGTRTLDQAAPPLVPPELTGDLAPARKRPITCLVGQSPLPRLTLQLPARIAMISGPFAVRVRHGRMLPKSHVLVWGLLAGDLRPGLSRLRLAASCGASAD